MLLFSASVLLVFTADLHSFVHSMQEWRLHSSGEPGDHKDSFLEVHEQVMCLCFSPFVPKLMAAGYSGGRIAIYSVQSSRALVMVQVLRLLFLCSLLRKTMDATSLLQKQCTRHRSYTLTVAPLCIAVPLMLAPAARTQQ